MGRNVQPAADNVGQARHDQVMRAVEVRHADRWCSGSLERWRHCERRGWIGYVWWREGVGLQHVEWITADRLRPVEL